MKKVMYIVILIILMVNSTACKAFKKLDVSKLEKSTYDVSQQSKDVALSIKEENIVKNTESITLIYTNFSDKEYIYGKEPHLEIEVDDIWYVVPTLETAAWDEMAYILSPNDIREDVFPIKEYYGELNEGSYRIVKTLYSDGESIFVLGEFKIKK